MFSSLLSLKYVFHASKYPLHLVVSEGVVAKMSLGRALFANIFARFRRSVRGGLPPPIRDQKSISALLLAGEPRCSLFLLVSTTNEVHTSRALSASIERILNIPSQNAVVACNGPCCSELG
jgi:hypothetical protein